ncbi:hypothetical protein [Pusillimonas minor]|uniref:ParB/Sulfiredoxin domain-containing protein n=1 Tax=Pusillimonas minor TaxID=2697024 RepID=A0A842HVC4_9BURK|nr:hypothetical protein [Pusillimonas minor]MBC2771131.1 hypothetical protein [Pusillimonas minor]
MGGHVGAKPSVTFGRNQWSRCSEIPTKLKEAEQETLRETLRVLVKADIPLDPFIVWRDSEGVTWIIDGHHRHEALTAAGTAPDALVWIQEAKVATEAEARAVALDINKRVHFSLHPKELIQCLWMAILTGEAQGSVRAKARRYQTSIGTVQSITKEAPKVLRELERRAALEGLPIDRDYIITNAPTWRGLKKWWKDVEKPKSADMQEKERQRITQALLDALKQDLKAQPEVVAEVFQEVTEEVTGKILEVTWRRQPEEDF